MQVSFTVINKINLVLIELSLWGVKEGGGGRKRTLKFGRKTFLTRFPNKVILLCVVQLKTELEDGEKLALLQKEIPAQISFLLMLPTSLTAAAAAAEVPIKPGGGEEMVS